MLLILSQVHCACMDGRRVSLRSMTWGAGSCGPPVTDLRCGKLWPQSRHSPFKWCCCCGGAPPRVFSNRMLSISSKRSCTCDEVFLSRSWQHNNTWDVDNHKTCNVTSWYTACSRHVRSYMYDAEISERLSNYWLMSRLVWYKRYDARWNDNGIRLMSHGGDNYVIVMNV